MTSYFHTFEEIISKHVSTSYVERSDLKKHIDSFVTGKNLDCNTYVIFGDSGVGKTAFVANYVFQNPKCIHYFLDPNIEFTQFAPAFLRYLYNALSRIYSLPEKQLSVELTETISQFNVLTERIQACNGNEFIQPIVIDGLDVSTYNSTSEQTPRIVDSLNMLCFPQMFRVILTATHTLEQCDLISKAKDAGQVSILSSSDSTHVRKFFVQEARSHRLGEYSTKGFKKKIELLVELSTGNFRHAVMQADELRKNSSALKVPETLPAGMWCRYGYEVDRLFRNTTSELANQILTLIKVLTRYRDALEPHVLSGIAKLNEPVARLAIAKLNRFFDVRLFQKNGKCQWFHSSFHRYLERRFLYDKVSEKAALTQICEYLEKHIDEGTFLTLEQKLESRAIPLFWECYGPEGATKLYMEKHLPAITKECTRLSPGALVGAVYPDLWFHFHRGIRYNFWNITAYVTIASEILGPLLYYTPTIHTNLSCLEGRSEDEDDHDDYYVGSIRLLQSKSILKNYSARQNAAQNAREAVQEYKRRNITEAELAGRFLDSYFLTSDSNEKNIVKDIELVQELVNDWFPPKETKMTTTSVQESVTPTQKEKGPKNIYIIENEIYLDGNPYDGDKSWTEFFLEKLVYTLFIDERNLKVWSYGENYSLSIKDKRAFKMLCLIARTPKEDLITYKKFYEHTWEKHDKSKDQYTEAVQKQFEINITPILFENLVQREEYIWTVPRQGYQTTDKMKMIIRLKN